MGIAFLFGEWLMLIPLLSLLAFGFFALKRGKAALLILIGFAGLGVMLGSIRIAPSQEKGTYSGVVIEARANYFIFLDSGTRYYVYEKENTREEGDFLSIEGSVGELGFTNYESRFSLEDHLRKKGVYHALTASSITVDFKRPLRLREYEVAFLAHFDEESASALDSLLFGHKDYDSDFIMAGSAIGAVTLLSTSGLLYGGLCRLFEKAVAFKLDGRKKEIAVFLFACLLLPFGIAKVGYWRVFLSRLLKTVLAFKGMALPPPISRNAITGLFLLLINYHLALDQGFLIGYGISFFMSLWGPYSLRFPKRRRALLSFCLLTSFLFPIYVSGGEFHLLSPFYSLLLLPLIYPFVIIGYVSFLTVPFTGLLNGYGGFLLKTLTLLGEADLSIPVGEYGLPMMAVFYASLLLFSYLMHSGLLFFARRAAALLAFIILLNALPLSNAFTGQVTFINVGQGDAILIRDRFTSVLIDTGGNRSFDMAEEVLIPFFRKEHVYKLDALIITHGDYDHNGAKDSLMANFRVKNVIDSASSFPCTIGNLHFVNYNVYGGEDDENEKSLVLYLEFIGKKWLFMGDAPIAIEESVIEEHPDLDCDIIKVGHHGSDTSSSFKFLQCVTPETAVISCGKNNYYGHPHQSVLTRLNSLGVSIRRTDEEGSVTFRRFA